MTGLLKALDAAAAALEDNAEELRRLDSISGDGDLGITASKVAKAIREATDAADRDPAAADPASVLRDCGRRIAAGAASSCGTLLASAFLAAAKTVGDGNARRQLAAGLTATVEAIAKRGKAAPGDRTMLDALAPAAQAAGDVDGGGSWASYLQHVGDAAAVGAEATRTMTPRIGRARTQPARAQGHPDAGAVLITVALTAALQAATEVRQP